MQEGNYYLVFQEAVGSTGLIWTYGISKDHAFPSFVHYVLKNLLEMGSILADFIRRNSNKGMVFSSKCFI